MVGAGRPELAAQGSLRIAGSGFGGGGLGFRGRLRR